MFREIDLSLARERRVQVLRGVHAERMGNRLRANHGLWPGSRRTVGAFLQGFPDSPVGSNRAGG